MYMGLLTFIVAVRFYCLSKFSHSSSMPLQCDIYRFLDTMQMAQHLGLQFLKDRRTDIAVAELSYPHECLPVKIAKQGNIQRSDSRPGNYYCT
jgi:hypothetical protein